ncbi:MAG: hypothetical protein ACLPHP_09625 [Candidatus Sulfotelmatobacter sp.]
MTGRSKAAHITNPMNLIQRPVRLLTILTLLLLAVGALPAQDASPAPSPAPQAPAYTPKYHGDPARSDSESNALGYMRVVMRAQMLFNKQYGHYATSLTQLVHTGTFTQRMVNPERGDYTVGFKGKKDGFVLALTPKNLDPQHRSFYAEDDGKIHADETNAADSNSQVVETHHW